MDEAEFTQGMESALNASIERRAALGSQQTHQRDVKILGTNLERLIVKLTADIEAIAEEADGREHTVQEYVVFVDNIYDTKLAMLKAFSEWLKLSGNEADPSVGVTVTNLELMATRLSDRLEAKIKSIPVTKSVNQSEVTAKVLTGRTGSKKGGRMEAEPKTISVVVRPKSQPKKIVGMNESLIEHQVDSSGYAKKLTTVAPQGIGRKSEKGTVSKTTSKSSSAAKLQARIEENEAQMQAEFHREADERARRRMARDVKRAKENRQRQYAEEWRRKEEELARQEEEIVRQEEEQKQRLEDEAEERAAALRAKEAEAKAKLKLIEQFEEEYAASQGKTINDEDSEPTLPSEEAVGSIDKAAAFVSELSKIRCQVNQQPDEDEIEERHSVDYTHQEERPTRKQPVIGPGMISNPRNANSEITGLLTNGQSKIINRNNTVAFPQVPVISESEILPDFWAQSAGEQRVRSARPDRATGYSTKHSLAPSSSLPAGVHNKINRVRTLIPEGREKVNRRTSGPPVTSWERTEVLCPTILDSKRTQEKSYKRSNKSDKITHKAINTDIKGRTRHVKRYVKQYREESGSNPSTDTEADSIHESRLPEFSGVQQAARAHLDNPIHLDTASSRNTNQMIEEMCGQLALSRLPISEPEKFDGRDPLSFPVWKLSFDALVNQRAMSDTDRLNLLNQFLGGEARAAISGYMMLEPHEAYQEAYGLLLERYGDSFKIANAFRDRLKAWSRVGGLDAMGLRKFVDFLKQCRTAKRSIPALRSLDDESENAEMLKKLPVWLSRQWLRRVSGQREATGEFPSFEVFVEFLMQEEKILNDPLARVIQKVENPKEKGRGTSFASESQSFSFASSNQNMVPNGRSFGACTFCAERHSIETCKKFSAEPFDFRQKFVQENRLCYGCLVRGHVSRECRNRRVCQICKNYHPTSMHRGDSLPQGPPSTVSVTACASNNHLSGAPRKSSMIVPIFISHCDNPEREELVYAMLDTQSDSSFVTENTARALGLKGKEVHLSLSTMTTNDRVIKCSRFNNLEIRGYESNKRIVLPQAYSRKSIPVNRQHIPSADMTKGWPHLEPLKSKLVPKLSCEVGVLIGYDCSKALEPQEVISVAKDEDGPFGLRTDLGWGIVGVIGNSDHDNAASIEYSHPIVANQRQKARNK